ncbi:hypothetical protein F4777DRAFT_575820 [Nemania sp. FL0916]|nr:hypothetical protein F4777DRAFT_575820 [Nemania sp. FL0916]
MEEMSGRQLDQAWPNMNDAARSHTNGALKQHFAQLHDLRPSSPGWTVQVRLCFSQLSHRSGPELADSFRLHLPDHHEIMLAYADISAGNILVDEATGDFTVVLPN